VPHLGVALACAHREDRAPPPRHLTPTPVAIDIAAACSGLGVRRFASVQKTRASSLASPRAWRKLLRILLARCSRFCGNNIQARPTGDFLIPSGGPWVQHRNWPPGWTLILGCNSKMRSAGSTNLRYTILTTPPIARSSFLSPFGVTCFV